MQRHRAPSPQAVQVLSALAADAEGWSHGYDLCLRTGLKAGTMYPILMRLADRGWLETAWEEEPPAGRPPRHLYRLTAGGLSALAGMESPSNPPARARRSARFALESR